MWARTFWPSSFWAETFWASGAAGAAPPGAPPDLGGGGMIRLRVMRRTDRHVEREIQTPAGPLILVVPDEWTADDLLQLTTALVLTDALH